MATHKISGKKKNKFRVTIFFADNATGTEKLPPFFIRKSAKPRCFQRKTGKQLGFYYQNNKKAWMTAILFEEWVGRARWTLKNVTDVLTMLQVDHTGDKGPNTHWAHGENIESTVNMWLGPRIISEEVQRAGNGCKICSDGWKSSDSHQKCVNFRSKKVRTRMEPPAWSSGVLCDSNMPSDKMLSTF